MNNPYILCAAIYYNDGNIYNHQPKNIISGVVVCGRRHHNCFVILDSMFGGDVAYKNTVQGFLTSDDRFVDRKEALIIATEAGQLEYRKKNPPKGQLLSEDLYDCIAEDFKKCQNLLKNN